MKTKILLPLICMAISLFTASCSSDDIVSPEAKEQMLTLTVSAGTEDDAAATRAELVEAEGSKSPWKWETGDKLMLVITNAGQKTVHTLDLKTAKRGGLSGEFEGQVPADRITDNSTYRFFYVGKTTDGSADRTISTSDLSAGRINIDLTQQTGELKDLKKNCVLMGTGKVVATSGGKAITEGSVILKNLFAVAHFAITADNNTTITKVGLRGKGVYASANVDLSTGAVTGVSEIGTEIDPETNIFFPKNDFYVTFVPGTVAPAFDGYYADSYTSVVTATPETRNYDASKSFVYYKGAKAKFSVSDNQQVAITNGNMQYVMPIATYTYTMNAKTLDANKLIRWKKSVPLKIKGTRTVHPGYYRLAPEQWETAMPKNTRTGGTYTYNTVTVGGKEYVSPEVYRYFDLPSWGTIDYPTLIDNTFTASNATVVKDADFGNKLTVGGAVTRTMTFDEWRYLMPNTVNISLPDNNRVWSWRKGLITHKRAKWARCFIDENGNGKRDTNPAELRGYLIFPDAMTMDEAKAVFTITDPEIGKWSVANNNPTTFAKIKSSGAVFIPLSAYRAKGSAKLEQWGNHGNYATSQYSGNKMLHLKITDVDAGSFLMIDATSAPDQGCMNRLVQNY
mgnify:FL=1